MFASCRQFLALSLIFLLLANSSMAVESAVHDGHEHGESAMPILQMDHGDSSQLPAHAESADHKQEDCICDDLCCLSNYELGSLSLVTDIPRPVSNNPVLVNLYQSIALDLVLPPPNA